MSSHIGDAWIDDQLRNVPVPGAVLQKLYAIASLDDAELDHALCDVAAPTGLLDRLRSIGSLDDADVDDELRHVLVPITLADRLRRIPSGLRRSEHSGAWVRRLAIAASLLVAGLVGYFAAVSPMFFGRPRQPGADPRSTVATLPNRSQPSGAGAASEAEKNAAQLANDMRQNETQRDNQRLDQPSVNPAGPDSAQLVSDDNDRNQLSTDATDPDQSNLEGVLAIGVSPERLPPLESMPPPVWRGVPPPRDRGYNWLFQLQHGVHPFVAPAASAALETCQVPLVTSSASFESALQLTAKRILPAVHRVRTEEFLAAMDYGFPPPEGRPVGIRTAIGPSPWGAPGTNLLQVAAQAQVLSRANQDGSHLVVILDASSSMLWEDRWPSALAGLRQYIQHMRPADRLTLVLMGEQTTIVAERQRAADALKALDTLPEQPSAGALNAVEAMQLASDAAGRGLAAGPGRIVMITDGALHLDEQSRKRIDSLLQASGSDAYRFEVFDVRQEQPSDDELIQLVEAAKKNRVGSGAVDHVATAGDIRWRLLEVAAGRSQLVAAKATMKVKFKPDAVIRYRLIGHEFPIAGLVSPDIEADLRSGEAATGLFEVFLKPDGGDTIATVEIAWQDPKTGEAQTRQQTVSRLQIAPSFHQASLSLQMAALAAETAEILRGSYFAPANSHSLASVTELGAQLNSRLHSRPSFDRLMKLIEQAQRSRLSE